MNKLVMVSFLVFAFADFGFSQGVNPVDRIRDYNGTYNGGPYSGSVGYTTLYRDNQDNGVSSGCRGEGCGRHPGVDIAVPSGTSVKASFGGNVVISRCDPAWGGLVVIRSSHPQRPWETIYLIYAHLKSRTYANGLGLGIGDYVTSGTIIGKTGGASGDACRGNSSGAHLHFQIDKDDGNLEPYYPSSGLNSRDDNFLVAGKTYNPIVMVKGGYKWKFAQEGNRELWDLFNWQSWGVSNGALSIDAGYDPYIRRGGLTNCGLSKPCSSSILAEASDYQSVYLDVSSLCQTGVGKIYFTTKNENFWDENKTVNYYPNSTGGYRGSITMSWHNKWTGVITGLRIDHSENCNPYSSDPIYFGEIGIVR